MKTADGLPPTERVLLALGFERDKKSPLLRWVLASEHGLAVLTYDDSTRAAYVRTAATHSAKTLRDLTLALRELSGVVGVLECKGMVR